MEEAMKRSGQLLVLSYLIAFLMFVLPVVAAPIVVSTDPANDATGILGNPEISVIFDRSISDDSSNPLTGTITISDGTNTLDYDYSYAYGTSLKFGNFVGPWLAADTAYTVTLTAFKDLSGDPMPTPYSWSFTTGPDTTPPTVFSSSPADNDVLVPIDIDAITITFSEPIVYAPAVQVDEVSLEEPWGSGGDIPFGTIIVSGNTMTIPNPGTPDPWFSNWQYYMVTIPGSGVKDLAGNELVDGNLWYYRFIFQTVSTDITAPAVVSTYPLDDSSNIPSDVTITASMSESINQCRGSVEMVDEEGSPVGLRDDCHTGTYYCTSDYQNLVIRPDASLVLGETYTVTITGLTDNRLNVMTPYSWSFTVQTPTQDLSSTVDGLGLPPDVESGLLDKLAAAQKQIDMMKYPPAKKILQAFINQVKSQQGKTIPLPVAAELVATAQGIIDSLSA
jgi:hypothetical protein